MTFSIHAQLLPALWKPDELSGGVAIVIDVLRASTTIIHAMSAGAPEILPCEDVDQARRWAAEFPPGSTLLGGERGGRCIEGFDLDNSPLAYTLQSIRERRLIFTTTNGTRALQQCHLAADVWIGAFVNRAAILRQLLQETRPVHLVCAGSEGGISADDALFAGAILAGVVAQGRVSAAELDDESQLALALWESNGVADEKRLATLRDSRGGQTLIALKLDADIARAAQLDLFDFVPRCERDGARFVLRRASCMLPEDH